MYFQSPLGHLQVERYSDAFVDDTQNGLNDAHLESPWSLGEIIQNLLHMAQTWERLLFCSGGALELSKCSYYIVYWKWLNGLPQMLSTDEVRSQGAISLTSGNGKTPISIKQRDVSEAHKTLGVWLAPNGDDSAQADYLRSKAATTAHLIISSNFTKSDTFLAYHCCWIPSICYSLGTSAMDSKTLKSVQGPATSVFLQKMGFNKHFPRAVAFGPSEMGG